MEELKSGRVETVKARQEAGAVDSTPGEVEGMQAETGAAGVKSRAMEKRKRQLEERRRLVEAKRRKLPNEAGTTPSSVEANGASNPQPVATTADPLPALESPTSKTKGKGKVKTAPVNNDADAFLAQLEHEIMIGKSSNNMA